MHLANLTTAGFKRILALVFTVFIYSLASAQENSPYSRYGIGDIVPNQNIVNRGMGGIAAGYTNPTITDYKYIKPDFLFQSINLVNPASIAGMNNTIFDVGGEIDIRTLKSTTSPAKYTATNTLISYLQIGVPLAKQKWIKKGNYWGLSFGIRPISRINYKVEKNSRLLSPNLDDSLNTLYEGSGGLNQVNISTAVKLKNFSIGVSGGYSFGTKDYSTKLTFINDTVNFYKSNSQAKSRYGGFFLNVGLQYSIKTTSGLWNLGAYGNLQQNLKAKRDYIDETITDDGNGGNLTIDTVNYKSAEKGTIKIPATYGLGFTYANSHWLFGADFETTNWQSYRFYGQKDSSVNNNWVFRAGVQYYPAKGNTPTNKYWSFVKYRAGFYYGPDYIKLDKTRPYWALTAGASFPLTNLQHARGEYVILNTGFEFGSRGNKQSAGVRENITRINIGISMNARWFQKRSYD